MNMAIRATLLAICLYGPARADDMLPPNTIDALPPNTIDCAQFDKNGDAWKARGAVIFTLGDHKETLTDTPFRVVNSFSTTPTFSTCSKGNAEPTAVSFSRFPRPGERREKSIRPSTARSPSPRHVSAPRRCVRPYRRRPEGAA